METIRYKNAFHNAHNVYSREYYEGHSPEEYKGFQIFTRSSIEYHIVKNGVCVGMNAGINGAKRRIDNNEI